MEEPLWAPSTFLSTLTLSSKWPTKHLYNRLPIHDEGSFPQLPEVRQVLNNLTHDTTGIVGSKHDVTVEHTLIIALKSESETDGQREIRADMGKRFLGDPLMRAVESFPRLDWTILAPDRSVH